MIFRFSHVCSETFTGSEFDKGRDASETYLKLPYTPISLTLMEADEVMSATSYRFPNRA